jgi:hypothetical protein
MSDENKIELVEAAELDAMCERRHGALARRVEALEASRASNFSDDPEKMIGKVLVVMAILILLPELISLAKELFRRWAQSSPSS